MTTRHYRTLRLCAVHREPRHRGLHIAVLSAVDADALGIVQAETLSPIYLQLHNPANDGVAFGRAHIDAEVPQGHVGLQAYLLANARAENGSELEASVVDIGSVPIAADIQLRECGQKTTAFTTDIDAIRQRLIDTELPLRVGHRFAFPLRAGESTFEVLSGGRGANAVRCGVTTHVELIDAVLLDGLPQFRKRAFTGIGGLHAASQRLVEIVLLPARHPEVFSALGIDTPKGVLLYGAPGTGKTLLGRAVADRIGASFYAINGPEIMSKFYGQSEQHLRDVFAKAVNAAPAVVFIDELDSIAPSRDRVSGDLEVRIVSQLLTLLDGLDGRGQVVVIGATNRLDAIDPALRRPGRFDCEIEIPPPESDDRTDILRIHTSTMAMAADVDLADIARRTAGYVGADLAMVCKEAALSAVAHAFTFTSNGDITPTGEPLVVRAADFDAGLRRVQPSAFRGLSVPDITLSWDDLVGVDGCKRDLSEQAEWAFTRREDLRRLGISGDRGILLIGPRSSGRTTLGIALARHMGLNVVYVRAIDILNGGPGTIEEAVGRAFSKARQTQPALVMIDDLDQLVGISGAAIGMAHRAMAQVRYEVGQLRVSGEVLTLVTSTDDVAESAALDRCGLGTTVCIPLPATVDLELILRNRLAGLVDDGFDFEGIARELDGCTVGEVLQICDSAARAAMREPTNTPLIHPSHIAAAIGGHYTRRPPEVGRA
ncbi:MAG TPA: AAA family ATPase [Armatimonadota bacterium]